MRIIAATARRKVRKPTILECIAFAGDALSRRPPELLHILRAEPAGSVLWRCVLPLEWCLPLNRYAELEGWQRQELKKKVLERMLVQHGFISRKAPLGGRPLVRAIRFSSVEGDADNGWTKVPVDRLTGKHGGLNFLVDDKPRFLDLRPWWEPAPPGKGFAYFEIWSGG